MILFQLSRNRVMGQSQISYCRAEQRRWNRRRGFRLSPRRFSLNRLRVRFLCFIRFLSRWKFSYGQAIDSLKKGIRGSKSCRRSYKGMATMEERRSFNPTDCSFRYSHGRSNSFYSEAIADCLEFIKRSSVSVNDDPVVVHVD